MRRATEAKVPLITCPDGCVRSSRSSRREGEHSPTSQPNMCRERDMDARGSTRTRSPFAYLMRR